MLTLGLQVLHRLNPNLLIELRTESGPVLITRLDEGSIDFAMMLLPPSLDQKHYAYVPVGQESVLALARPSHPILQLEGISTQALLETTWALPPRREPLRERVAFVLMAAGIEQPPQLFEVHSSAAALELALSMDLIVLVPESQAQTYVRNRLLVPLTLPFSLPKLPFGVVRVRHRHLRPGSAAALRSVLDALRQRKRRAAGAPPDPTSEFDPL
jgi:DNA-binding transcriptional LysR family regulator